MHQPKIFFCIIPFEFVESFGNIVGTRLHKIIHDFLLLLFVEDLIDIIIDV